MSLDDFEETNDPEVSFEVPAIVNTVQGNQLKEFISSREQREINRALFISKLENENARIKEEMFIAKMNDFGRKAERPFEIIEVPGEGNCFYHAILATINSSRPILIDHLTLRARVAEELTANKAKYFSMFKIAYQSTFVDGKSEVKRYSTCSYEDYVSDQRNEGVYADVLAIKALTNVLSMSIRVISSTDGEQIATTNVLLKKPKKMLARITIFNRNNEHFYGCKYLTPPSSRSESRSTNPSASPSRKRRNESRTKTAKSQGENSMDVNNWGDEKVSGRNENVLDSNQFGGNNMDR